MTVLDLVAMGAWRRVGAWRRYRGEELDGCMQALETVGLAAEAGRGLDALSGGQMQRALFARMLVQDASVLLLDEPLQPWTAIPPISSWRCSAACTSRAAP